MYKFLKTAFLALAIVCLSGRLIAHTSAKEALPVSSSASSAILYEPSTGTVLYEKNAHIKRPMASTTKLMTALLTAECLPPDRVVTVRREALEVIGSTVGLQAGDRLTVRDLLYALLLASGNDAANVLAFETDGSLDAYAARMNARAEAIGMTDTCFVTPSGLDAEGHGSTAYDMALLAAEVLKNDRTAEACATVTADIVVSDRVLTVRNHNRLLTELEGCVGMKTGYTSQSGRCLVTAATRDGVTLIAVTLDCADDWAEHRAMLEEGFACVKNVVCEPPALTEIPVFGGTSASVSVTGESVSFVGPRDAETPKASVRAVPYVWAPIEAGETLGSVEYRVGDTVVATAPLVATASVDVMPRAPFLTRVWDMFFGMLRELLSG